MLVFTSLLLVTVHAETGDFNKNTANTLSAGDWSVGIAAPLRYGLKDDLELEINPIAALLAPHIAVKKSYSGISDWKMASHHQLGYPTPFLKAVARGGTGGILAPDSVIPHTFVLQNDLLFGKKTKVGEVTTILGANFALELGDRNYTTIDYSYGFRQTNLYQNTLSLDLGVAWKYFFTEKLGFRYLGKAWYYPLADQKFALEEKLALLFQVSERSQASIGGFMTLYDYPYGTNWHVWPTVDWVWKF
jgi:hypothetical protein